MDVPLQDGSMFEALPFGSDKGLRADGEISRLARSFGLSSFAEAARRVQRFPYGRNTNRADYRLVLAEMRGTCSTKHALLAALAAENQLEVDLVLAVYEMTEANTPGVGAVLSKHGLTNVSVRSAPPVRQGNQGEDCRPQSAT